MTSQAANIPILKAEATVLPPAVLENLAARFRPGGLFLVVLRQDGSVAYHDPGAGVFFERYVFPLLKASDPTGRALRERFDALAAAAAGAGAGSGTGSGAGAGHPNVNVGGGSSGAAAGATASASPPGVAVWELPGVSFAAFAHVEKRQAQGFILLAAKAAFFSLGEDVLRACGQFGLDGLWLLKQSEELPAYGEEAIRRQGRLLSSTLRDQVRLSGLENELNSLSGQLANTYEELSLIYQVSSGMKINRRASDFFKQACLDVLEVMNVRGMGVTLNADISNRPEPALYGPMNLDQADVARLAEELTAMLWELKGPLLINDLSADRTFHWLGSHARQLLAVPLQRQDQVLGCLFALDKEDGEFDSVDTKLLNSIANESAIYLENAMLFEDVHGLMMGLLHSLTSAVDAKDAYTCGHSERVALVSRHLAQQMSLSEKDVEQIYMAGLLHDVGKIGVPEAVLQKTGKLTVEEFEQMKRHPQIGARILQDIKQVREIVPGVLHHHERYDGKGYPSGLAGEKIPLMGRIICLADCFDAMTSNRTYRKALPLEVALTEIRRCSGTQFDPRLAEFFLMTGPDGFRELLRDHQLKSKKLRELQESLRTKWE
jgi:putative nucleotidyltransferase with HDIG domain